ncbi:MAG: glycosyltransferase family 4 protein, partial [Anaerolineae bacterium]
CMVTSVPLPPREGIGWHVWNLSQFLKGSGHLVQIVTRGQRDRPACEEIGGIPVWRPRFVPLYPFHVHLHGVFAQHLLDSLQPELELLHLHTPLPPPLRVNAPCLLTVHSPMMAERRAIHITGLRELLIRLQIPVSIGIERRLLAAADGLAAVAHSVAGELGAYGIDRSRIRVVGNAVDTSLFCPAEGNGNSRPRGLTILAAGRLDVGKGLGDLIESMKVVVGRLPSVRLWIAGSGPMENHLTRRVERLGLGQTVRFLGHLERAEMIERYQAATLFVHAAHHEGLPTVLLEAMACGKASVSTAVSGALDVVKDGVNGLLVPPRTPAALAGAISHLLADADLRARLGAAARHTVEESFSWSIVGQQYVRYYRDLLEQKGR